jgi:formylglycine-generating enzyme required for sulfatase activity
MAWLDGVHEVATKKPNPWGLYDIYGNVSEQVQDMLGNYPAGMVTDPLSTKGMCPVTRGGSWTEGASRSSGRRCLASSAEGSRNDGFRLVRTQQ